MTKLKKKITQENLQNLVGNLFNLPTTLKDKNLKIIPSGKKDTPDYRIYGINDFLQLMNDKSIFIKPQKLDHLLANIDKGLYIPDSSQEKDIPPSGSTIVSSIHGNIKKILMTFPSYKENESSIYAQILLDLLQQMKEVDFYIFTAVDVYCNTEPEIAEYKRPYHDLRFIHQITQDRQGAIQFIIPEKKEQGISFWAQDPFVALKENSNQFYLVEPYTFNRPADYTIANDIEVANKKLDIRQTQVELYFEGGNILVGDDFILIGEDHIELTDAYLRRSYPELIESKYVCTNNAFNNSYSKTKKKIAALFQFAFGCKREVIIIGNGTPNPPYTFPECRYDDDERIKIYQIDGKCHHLDFNKGKYQVFAHIDTFITLVGRKTSFAPYVILVGELYNISGFESKEFNAQYFDPLVQQLEHVVNFLKNLKDENQNQKFDVKRIPIPVTYLTDNDNPGIYYWKHLSYNNCIIENSATKRNVYFPTYGSPIKINATGIIKNFLMFKIFDAYLESFWKSLGFNPHPLINYLPLMLNGGAAHCITKCLSREEDINQQVDHKELA